MSDNLEWYVKVGNRYVHYDQFSMYVKHCFQDHEDDIMGWDLTRSSLHEYVKEMSDNDSWDDEDDKALDIMVDNLLSCPVCNKVRTYNNKWYCTTCQRQITLKDVVNVLKQLKKDTGIQHSMEW
jgi:hypothetical protein